MPSTRDVPHVLNGRARQFLDDMRTNGGRPRQVDTSGFEVGRNLQDHVALYCVWEHRVPLQPRNTLSEAVVYWTTSDSDTPDVYICQAEVPIGTEETIARFGMPGSGWIRAGERPCSNICSGVTYHGSWHYPSMPRARDRKLHALCVGPDQRDGPNAVLPR